MREIKFRAWEQKYQFMTKKVLIGNTDIKDSNYTAHAIWIEPEMVDYKCGEPHWMSFDEYSDITIMQYTGLKDKNEVEIYEGDIVKYNYSRSDYANLAITFHNGRFCFDIEPYQFGENFSNVLPTYGLEVIGNIYENPELLELK
jgi:uncharacterized phage protein (TIGR01671 family)